MKRGIHVLGILLFLCVLFSSFVRAQNVVSSQGAQPTATQGTQTANTASAHNKAREILFVTDASTSIETIDPNHYITDVIRQIAKCLSDQDKAGVICYNAKASLVYPVKAVGADFDNRLAMVTYHGYSNPGAAIQYALSFFSDEDTEKSIFLLTDGEICGRTDAETKNYLAQMNAASSAAAQAGIPIHCVLCEIAGGERDQTGTLARAAQNTGGKEYHLSSLSALFNTAFSLTFDTLGIQKSSLDTADVAALSEQLSLPSGTAKFLIDATNWTPAIEAPQWRTSWYRGKQFYLLTVEYPISDTRREQVAQFLSGAQNVSMISYYQAALQARDEGNSDTGRKLSVWAADAAQADINLFSSPSMEGKSTSIQINGVPYPGTIQNGVVSLTLPRAALGSGGNTGKSLVIQSALNGLPGNYTQISPITLPLRSTTVSTGGTAALQALDLRLLLVVCLLLLLLWFLAARWYLRGRTLVPAGHGAALVGFAGGAATVAGRFQMVGRLEFTDIRLPEAANVADRVFPFTRCGDREGISLHFALIACGINLGAVGAKSILLGGDEKQRLCVTCCPGCTLMQDGQLLLAGQTYPLQSGDTLRIQFEDERSGMTMRYLRA